MKSLRSIHFDPFQRSGSVWLPAGARLVGVHQRGDYAYVDAIADWESAIAEPHRLVCLEADDPVDGLGPVGEFLGNLSYGNPAVGERRIFVFDGELSSTL